MSLLSNRKTAIWHVHRSTSASENYLSCYHPRRRYPLLNCRLTKVEFRVNGEKVDYAMKLGEGGEAFFVFQTDGDVPEEMQTSPIVSPDQSPVFVGAGEVCQPRGRG
jgi:phosphatidate phosphatase PAH1